MNCSYCQCQFDHSAHTPRLLIFCGHSLCERCCQQMHTNSRIQCPECLSNTFIEEVNFLPKNLALLKVNSTNSANNHGHCLKHQKKYQAFCKKQKVLICVDCILHDNHRNHEMDSIKSAHTQEDATLRESIQNLENMLLKVQNKYDQNLNNEKEYCQNYESTCHNVHQYFQEIRELVDREQDGLMAKMKEQYDVALIKFQEKNIKYIEKIELLSGSLVNLKASGQQSEIQFLGSVNLRQEIIASISAHVEQSYKATNFTQTKNIIADTVIKSIEKNIKTIANNGTVQSNSSTNKTQHANVKNKKASSLYGQQVPTMKPYESVQLTSNQNSKPMSKKVSRKDPIQASPVISSGSSSIIANKSSPIAPLSKACINVDQDKRNPAVHRPKISDKEKFDMGKNCDISVVEQKQSLFNSFFSNMTSFLTEQRQIYVIGGFDEESSNVIKFNLNSLKWEQVASLKAPRSKFGCAVVDKSIFILGGKKGKQRVSDIEIWNHGNWKSSPSLRKKRSGFGVVSYQNFIYIIGGNDGENILNSVEILNTITGEWIKTEPMNEARDELAACMGKDQRIYAIGGFGGKNNQSLRTVQAFDLVSQKWQKVPSLNFQRRALAAASLADGIYAIGGFDGLKHLSSVQKYQQGSSQWVRVADLRRGRCTHSAVSLFDTQQIIIMGGFDEQALDSVQKYSLITNQWEQIARMPSPRFMHSSVLLSQ